MRRSSVGVLVLSASLVSGGGLGIRDGCASLSRKLTDTGLRDVTLEAKMIRTRHCSRSPCPPMLPDFAAVLRISPTVRQPWFCGTLSRLPLALRE